MKTIKKIENLSRQTWLAGVGVLDSSRSKTVDNLDKFYVDSNAFMNELMARGEVVEQQLQAKFKGRIMIDEKIAALKAKLGMQKETRDIKIDKLSSKVDRLIEAVAVLAQQKEAEKSAAAKTARKPAAPKAAAKTTATKTAATKATTTAKTTTRKSTASAAKPKATASKATAAKPAATKAPAKPRVRKAAAKPAASEGDTEE